MIDRGPVLMIENEDGTPQLRDIISRFWCSCGKAATKYYPYEFEHNQFTCAEHAEEAL